MGIRAEGKAVIRLEVVARVPTEILIPVQPVTGTQRCSESPDDTRLSPQKGAVIRRTHAQKNRPLAGSSYDISHLVAIGGGGEIRTHERLPVAGFQDRCNRPLCHTSCTYHDCRNANRLGHVAEGAQYITGCAVFSACLLHACSNSAMDSTCEVCGNMLAMPAPRST